MIEIDNKKMWESLLRRASILTYYTLYNLMQLSLADQGLQYKDGQIVNSRSDTWFDPRHDCGNKQKQEWSEEDDYNWSKINEALQDKYTESYSKELFNWLKSLCPQNRWKPSEEQIEILDMVLTNESMDDNVARILRELREQLKKLREG